MRGEVVKKKGNNTHETREHIKFKLHPPRAQINFFFIYKGRNGMGLTEARTFIEFCLLYDDRSFSGSKLRNLRQRDFHTL